MLLNSAVNKSIIHYLFILTGFYFLLEISFFIQCNHLYLGDFSFITNHLKLPLRIVPGIIFFILMQILLHLSYAILVWFISILCWHRLPLSSSQKIYGSM